MAERLHWLTPRLSRRRQLPAQPRRTGPTYTTGAEKDCTELVMLVGAELR